MSKDFLLEIGMEEVPARFIPEASLQLEEKITQFLKARRIGFHEMTSYSTPRRLAVWIKELDEKQADLNEELRGPSKRIALDESGNWSMAAIGFARGKGAGIEDLYLQEVKGEEYVFVRKSQAGEQTPKILPELETVITSLNFPKNMRWGTHDLKFVRPIRWLIALYGDDVLPLTISGVQSDRITYGHRFLGKQISIQHPEQYEALLAEQYCIVNPMVRKNRIIDQIHQLELNHHWYVPLDDDLLDEVTHLVEYPTVFFGSFDESYLQIPNQVLITSMREHQRYFPVENQDGNLLSSFVAVRNGDSQNIEGVARGNEKVLRARLADAQFFYEEDQKKSIEHYQARLETVVFHEGLGTLADKVRRVRELSGEWTEMLRLERSLVEAIDRTASICKFDLVSQMVYEFPELQGIMGQDYAHKFGEPEEVSKGIFEHYLPRFSGDILPSSLVGALVGVADKMDTIVGSFAIGIIPTGSQDPYGLRRAAQGIVQILLEFKINLTLDQLFSSSLRVYRKQNLLKKSEAEIIRDLHQFFTLRLKNVLQEHETRYDVIDAVLSISIGHLYQLKRRAEVLNTRVLHPEFKKTVESFTRVNNLANKAEHDDLNVDHLMEIVEKDLYQEYKLIKQQFDDSFTAGDFDVSLSALAKLQPYIEAFFEKVMIMVEDEKIRSARLALLKKLSRLFLQFADFNKLIF